MLWWALTAAAAIGLFAFRGRNAVGGGGSLGLIVGILLAFVWPGATWWIIGKAAVVGALVGLTSELVSRLVGKRSSS